MVDSPSSARCDSTYFGDEQVTLAVFADGMARIDATGDALDNCLRVDRCSLPAPTRQLFTTLQPCTAIMAPGARVVSKSFR